MDTPLRNSHFKTNKQTWGTSLLFPASQEVTPLAGARARMAYGPSWAWHHTGLGLAGPGARPSWGEEALGALRSRLLPLPHSVAQVLPLLTPWESSSGQGLSCCSPPAQRGQAGPACHGPCMQGRGGAGFPPLNGRQPNDAPPFLTVALLRS